MTMHYRRFLFVRTGVVCAILLTFALVAAVPGKPAMAAVGSWEYRGVSIEPRWDGDFASDSFRQSVANAAAAHVNSIALIIPLRQSSIFSTDIHTAWNTPTDATLTSAIAYIHSLGLRVMLKPHLDSDDGQWRANINPADRASWFANYKATLSHYAALAQSNGVESLCIGTELISMATATSNTGNTQNWNNLIAAVRTLYRGQLTYSANWGGPGFPDEKNHIEFWNTLDVIGISAYFNLSQDYNDSSVQAQKNAWNQYQSDIAGLASRWGKPIVFTEVGYRSVTGAHTRPWDYWLGGSPSEIEQANDYEALFEYWNSYSYMNGVEFWNWESDPNAGWPGSTTYTVQHKQAQDTMARWFGNAPAPTPTPTPPPAQTGAIEIWWPSGGARIGGTQPFKTMLENRPVTDHQMYWQVDGDRLNPMADNYQDYPHKETLVDLSGWTWKGVGPYTVNFVAKDASGIIAQKSVDIFITR